MVSDFNTKAVFSKDLIPLIRQGKEKEVIALLNKGADPNIRGEWGFTALNFAVLHGMRPAVIDKMLEKQADPMARGERLPFASSLDLLVEGAQKVFIGGYYHHIYDSEERVSIAKTLVRHGADVNGPRSGVTRKCPLYKLFAAGGDLQLAAYLISQKAKGLNAQSPLEGLTPLHLCACRGQVDHVRFLIQHKANPFIIDDLGLTPRAKAELSLAEGKDVNVEKLTKIIELLEAYEKQAPNPIKRFIQGFGL